MTKNDFTPEYVQEKLEPYIMNQDYPADELSEVGGTHVSMTGLSDLEVSAVKHKDSYFIVEGTATIETTTDMGDGESTSDTYPMTFSYRFDQDGKVDGQISRDIDTSSFFEGGPV